MEQDVEQMARRGRPPGSSPYADSDHELCLEIQALVARGMELKTAVARVAPRAEGQGSLRAKRARVAAAYARFAVRREVKRREAELALEHRRRLEQAMEQVEAEILRQQREPAAVAFAAEMAEHSRRFAAEATRHTTGCAGLSFEKALALIKAGGR